AGARGAAVPDAGAVLAGPRGTRGEDATTGGRLGSREEGVGQRSIEDGPRRPRGPAPRSGARRNQEGRRRQRAAESGCPLSGGKRGRPGRGGPGRAGGSGPAGPPRNPSSTPGPDGIGR